MTTTAEIEAFIREHRERGRLAGEAAGPTANGYMLTVACACGVTFDRWITPLDASEDLWALVRLN